MQKVLDDQEFPFTETEVRRAFGLALPHDQAERVAAEIAAVIQAGMREGRGEPASPKSWQLSPEVYALLWCLPECSGRVDDMMRARWARAEENHAEHIMVVRGLHGTLPPADVLREARRQVAPQRAGWTRRKRAMADRLGVPRPDGSVSVPAQPGGIPG